VTLTERRRQYRQFLQGAGCLYPASIFDPVSARLAEAAGFEIGMLAGSIASATVLGAPDIVVLTLTEFAEQARRIARAGSLPLMVDADHGYGNALSVMRTVAELEAAGVSALTIEDTRLPRGFGQDRDEFISEEEFAGKVRAAVAARSDGDLVVLGRTGVLPTQGMDALAARVKACEGAGADGVFFTGVKSRDQVQAIHAMTRLPVVLGSTPPELHDREFLAANGVRIALQGHMPFQVAVRALQASYAHLREGRPPAELKEQAASPELMDLALGRQQYDAWTDEFL
jgi:carboxyvinyl-carboxyphosphonate phosphorylmutase